MVILITIIIVYVVCIILKPFFSVLFCPKFLNNNIMNRVIVITDHKNSFITVLPTYTNLKNWACNWIETVDNDIEFWDNGNISIDRSVNEINIYGGNGMICLSLESIITTY